MCEECFRQDQPVTPPISRRGFVALAAAALGLGAALGEWGCTHGDPFGLVARRPHDLAPPTAGHATPPHTLLNPADSPTPPLASTAAPHRMPAAAEVAPSPAAAPSVASVPADVGPADRYPLNMTLFPDPAGHPIATAADAPLLVIPRARWTIHTPHLNEIVMMDGIARITIHHTGFDRPWTSDGWRITADEIENIRNFHTGPKPLDRHWADIAYHFLIDRAGRVWQGRPLAYQGAHVKNHNQHNLGIVLLGNFDLQRGSAAQLVALRDFVKFVAALYHVPIRQIFTHHELADNKTDCPGFTLQAYLDRVRPTWGGLGGKER